MCKGDKYSSPDIQNEKLEIMGLPMLCKISKDIQYAAFFTIMAGETADISNKEQLVVCIRWVDENLVHGYLKGMYPMERERATVHHIVAAPTNMPQRIENASGQCYDGVSTMAGEINSVAPQMKALNNIPHLKFS